MTGKISGRECDSNVIVSTGPDVCLTPVGGSMVPVAYTSVSFLGESTRTSSTVLDNESPDFQLNSRAVTSTGHEPGTGKGVVVPGYKGEAFICTASPTVFSESWATTRHRDPAAINRPGSGAVEPQIEPTGYYERILERVEGRQVADGPMSAPPGGIDYDALSAELDAHFAEPEVEEAAPAREHVEPGTNQTVEDANGAAQLVTGATAEPERDFRRREGESGEDYLRRLREEGLDRASTRADPEQKMNDLWDMWEAVESDPDFNAWDQGIVADAYHDPTSVPNAVEIYSTPTGGRFEIDPADAVDHAMARRSGVPYAFAGANGSAYQTNGPTFDTIRDLETRTQLVQTRAALSERYRALRESLGLPQLDADGEFKGSPGGKGPREPGRTGTVIMRGGRALQLGPMLPR